MPVSETSFDPLLFCNHFELIFNPACEKFTPLAATNKCMYIRMSTMPETANRAETEQGQVATFFLIGPILFLYHEESLVSLNLNSKLSLYI